MYDEERNLKAIAYARAILDAAEASGNAFVLISVLDEAQMRMVANVSVDEFPFLVKAAHVALEECAARLAPAAKRAHLDS